MCGFVGFFGKFNPIKEKELLRATKLLEHRGNTKPQFYYDDLFSCGFSRLAMLDLNSEANQPYIKKNYDFVLCFNGELYNYKELRKTLENENYVFQTNSDTEVLYYAFDLLGEKCFEKLRGMFAVVIYDLKQKLVYLARDHLGIKPLYYTQNNGYFYFASEVKAFKVFKALECEETHIVEFLSYGETLDESTIFRDIFKLNPGQFIKIDLKFSQVKKDYFCLEDTFKEKVFEVDLSWIEFLLKQSVYLHTNCDVDYGAQLSGGLDSGFISALARQHNPSLQTFSVSFKTKELDESRFQKILNNYLGTKAHFLLHDDFFDLEELKKAIYFEDFPLHHPNILASNQLNKIAKDCKIQMLLSGDGADEVFCGYNYHLLDRTLLKNLNFEQRLQTLSYVPTEELLRVLNLPQKSPNQTLVKKCENLCGQDMVFLGQKIYLQKWLRRQDRSGMQNGVEIRVPFVDIELFKALNAYALSVKTKCYQEPKYLLKKIARAYLPKELIYQPKIGFPMPIKEAFEDKRAKVFWEILYSKEAKQRQIYNYEVIDHLIYKSKNTSCSRILWLLINLELWFEIFIDE